MSKENFIELQGVVTDTLVGSKFKVRLNDNGMTIMCTLSGKMRMNKIRILTGDSVTVELSPYDLTKGRITYRDKK